MIKVFPGTYMMGQLPGEPDSDDGDEEPRHEVTINSVFWMSKYEVTQDVWRAATRDSVRYGDTSLDYPANGVSWNEVNTVFLDSLTNFEGSEIWRLPSEAEWEYVCRAGEEEYSYYSWGNDVTDFDIYGWHIGNSGNGSHPVGEKDPNPWGFKDMHGNVWEYCSDGYHSTYNGAPTDGSSWLSSETTDKIRRGGAYSFDQIDGRSASRDRVSRNSTFSSNGFRLVRIAD
jgi:formylglycine-generating enzyme required for sulfatase activity